MDLVNDVIPVWVVMYDNRQDLMYVLSDRDAVRRSVNGAIADYVDESTFDAVDKLVRIGLSDKICVVKYRDNTGKIHILTIIRVELDNQSKVHKILARILGDGAENIAPDLFIDAISLFADPYRLTIPPKL